MHGGEQAKKMKILALESSSLVASAAILEDETIIAEYTTNFRKTHSQTLLPMVDEIVKMTGTDLHTLDAIAVSSGPGSFTGLRIGAATAKGLGLALNIPLIAVPTLDAAAYNFMGADGIVCPIMDARRSQVYNGLYHTRDSFEIVRASRALAVEELIGELNEMGERVIFSGDGVPVSAAAIDLEMKVPYCYAPANMNRQRAAAVAALGGEMFKRGDTVPADAFVPEYLRMSQAERERQERHAAGQDSSAQSRSVCGKQAE